jgi:adenosylcobinamide-GDP ribazoletransferase
MSTTQRAAATRRGVLMQCVGALAFLTAFPVPRRAHGLPTAWTLACFGIAGLALGGVAAGVEVALAPVLPVAARSAVVLATLAGCCGAMHLDGVMDSFDGLFGARTRERRLEIMRDSRVGAYGLAAAVLLVLVQYAALASVASQRAVGLLCCVGLSRAASALALGVARPARDEGLGSVYSVPGRLVAGCVAFACAGAAAVALCGWRGVAGCLVTLGVVLGVVLVFRRRVGGMTGDGFGAVVELSLAGALLCLAAQR